MKSTSFPNCRKITIEHENGVEVFETSGSARIDAYDNGVLEIRTFSAQAQKNKGPGPKRPAGQSA